MIPIFTWYNFLYMFLHMSYVLCPMSLNNLQQQQQKGNIAIYLITHVPCPQTIFELKIPFSILFLPTSHTQRLV